MVNVNEEKDINTHEEQELNESENASIGPDENIMEQAEEQEENWKEQCAGLEKKLAEQKDKYLRLFADFDNYKKRAVKERIEMIKLAGEDIVMGLLPVLDDFERAMKTIEDTSELKSVKEGMELIYNKLLRNLETKGVRQMKSQHEEFNADFHEAVTEIPAPAEELKGKVIDEVEKGYYLNDKIIRYAKVVVGK